MKRFGSVEEQLFNIKTEQKYLKNVFEMICEKYEVSGMNTLKVIKTRSIPGVDDIEALDHKISPKVVEKIYSLFKRLIESYNENTQKIEIHYSTVISDKEVIIGELCDQVKCLENEIRRIHELRKKVEHDVDVELKELDQMGDLNSLEKPTFLLNNLTSYDLANDEASFILEDIYQFLQFQNEYEDSNSKMCSYNYEEMERILIDKFSKIQQSTAFKVLKRVIKKVSSVDSSTQTSFMSNDEEYKLLQGEMNQLYRDKYILKEELNKKHNEIGKLRTQLQKLEKENSDLFHELKLQNKGGNNSQLKRIESIRGSEKQAKNSKMIDQYKEIIK